jgi:hypothetical protein
MPAARPAAGLRLCPQFVNHHFTPALKTQLKQQGIARTLYDDTNLQALVNRCARRSSASLTAATCIFCALSAVLSAAAPPGIYSGLSPMSSSAGRQTAAEFTWRRRLSATGSAGSRTPHAGEQLFLALLFMLLKTPIRSATVTSRIAACTGHLRPDSPLSGPRGQNVQR